ncbi:MAG: sodium:panthothenate symporter [Kiritimatiellae bacterium]|nr:sodium:panthothenate symporter [Kiritimatiellia bacterium]
MTWYDWLILLLPVTFVMGMGFYTRRFVRGVTDFLSAGRLCSRYVICMGDVANSISIIALVTYVEIHYKTGFSVGFWSSILAPLGILLSLTGFCTYRFRATRAMSLGQFLEMRYSRGLRIYGASLRSAAEMIANMIMPSIAARFFMQLLDLPTVFHVCGVEISTYVALMLFFLSLAVTLICCGGTLALVVADTVQATILFPLLVCFIVFVLWKFSVAREIMPVMADRVAGESFINPFDIGKLRDFNLFTMVVVPAYWMVMNRASWFGNGYTTAAKSPHEQKMAGVLGAWRGAVVAMFYLVVACALITFLNHADFAEDAAAVRRGLASRVAADVLQGDPAALAAVEAAVADTPALRHEIGVDPPLSQTANPDTAFLAPIHEALLAEARYGRPAAGASGETAALANLEGIANDRFQQIRTLFHQQSLSATMRHLLPPGLFGAFALLLFLAMLSSDDTRIYSAALTIAQDVVMPLRKKPFTPRGHIRMIRLVSIGVGAFFLLGSYYMKQLDYIQMFTTLAVSIWTSGAGPVMVLGLYTRFGTAAGAWAALLTSTIATTAFVFVQRSWADLVYPALAKAALVDPLDRILRAISAPFAPYIQWKMDAVKCPVNTIEFSFFLALATLFLYVVVSKLTCRKPFDLDAMLHKDSSASDCNRPQSKSIFRRLVGITPDYTRGDRAIAWGVFFYSVVFSFGLCFLAVAVWNAFAPWPVRWWSRYFVFMQFVVPAIVASVSTVWFGVGGVIGLRQLFRDLAARGQIDETDDGRVG